MKAQKVKLLLLISLASILGAVLTSFAAGSHFQIGYVNGSFNCDIHVATGESTAAAMLGLMALATFVCGLILHLSPGRGSISNTLSDQPDDSQASFSEVSGWLRTLTKSKTDVWLGGVCGGLGEHTPLPSWGWRLLFLVLVCFYGGGILAYLLLWICLPEQSSKT